MNREIDRASLDPRLAQRAVHGLDDVAAQAKVAQSALGVFRQHPLRRANWDSETKPLQFLQTADFESLDVWIRLPSAGAQVDDPGLISAGGDGAVEPGPTIGVDLSGEIFVDALLRLRPQLQTDQALRSCAHPVRNIVARDHEIGAIVRLAAKKDVDVRIVRIPMVNANPVEFGPEIAFGLAEKVASEGA